MLHQVVTKHLDLFIVTHALYVRNGILSYTLQQNKEKLTQYLCSLSVSSRQKTACMLFNYSVFYMYEISKISL